MKLLLLDLQSQIPGIVGTLYLSESFNGLPYNKLKRMSCCSSEIMSLMCHLPNHNTKKKKDSFLKGSFLSHYDIYICARISISLQ